MDIHQWSLSPAQGPVWFPSMDRAMGLQSAGTTILFCDVCVLKDAVRRGCSVGISAPSLKFITIATSIQILSVTLIQVFVI